ncbi:hypothetical protein LINPERHAP1_LOCUS30892 [Linum perenne]
MKSPNMNLLYKFLLLLQSLHLVWVGES